MAPLACSQDNEAVRRTSLYELFDRVDPVVVRWMARHGVFLLRVSVGIVFLWFGALKFFPGISPAEGLAGRTIEVLTFGVVGPNVSLPVLATWECLIGLGLIFNVFMRLTLLLLFLQMPGTLASFFIAFPEMVPHPPFGLSLEGQYVVKNLVLIAAGIVVGATVRGGRLIADQTMSDQR